MKSLTEWWVIRKEIRHDKRRRKERLAFIHALDEAIHKSREHYANH